MADNYNEMVANSSYDKSRIDDKKIKWTTSLSKMYKDGRKIELNQANVVLEMYRPFTKKWLYYDKQVIERPGQFYSKWGKSNLALVTTGRGTSKNFSIVAVDTIPCLDLMEKGQGFIQNDNSDNVLFDGTSNISEVFANKSGLSLGDVFAYVYGLLSSPGYQRKYANDLRKDLARIPIVANKEKYVEVGRRLMDLHINYENVPIYDGVDIEEKSNPSYVVKKMRFAKVKNPETGKLEKDRSTIIFNDDITIRNIPEKAYGYVVNGRSVIEWIMDQYQNKTDRKSGITDDPNDFSDDPKYIYNLLLRIINVSIQTVDLVNSLPELEISK